MLSSSRLLSTADAVAQAAPPVNTWKGEGQSELQMLFSNDDGSTQALQVSSTGSHTQNYC